MNYVLETVFILIQRDVISKAQVLQFKVELDTVYITDIPNKNL